MILVLGASSYVGKRSFQVFGASRALGTFNSNPVPGCVFFDARRMRLSEIIPDCNDISHAVIFYAEAGIDECKADLVRSYDINVRSTKEVIDDLNQLGIKPIFMSSEYVFDGDKGGYTEVDSALPTTVYGSQKLEIEEYLAEQNGDYTVLRLAKVFGTDPEDGTILSSWLKQIQNGEEIRCARDQVFSPVHVDDVVAMTDAVIRLNLRGVYHVGNTAAYSRLEMLRTLLDCMRIEARVTECSIRDFQFLDHRPLNLSLDSRKVLAATGLGVRSVDACCRELVQRVQQTESIRVATSD